MTGAEQKVRKILALGGIVPNGSNPWDIRVHNQRFYRRVLAGGSLAVGESYMDGWWDVDDMADMFDRIMRIRMDKTIRPSFKMMLYYVGARILNFQSKKKAFEVGEQHYDIGNDLYRAMLGTRMTYTCGYWKNAKTLDEAQEAKLELICKKIGLKAGDRVLDIGGGWGSFAGYAAEKYGASVVAITISKEQAALGRELTAGLPVEIRVQDYRDVTDGPYDHIVSIGMFEHVGWRNYRTFMKKTHELLSDDGLFLLHTIGSPNSVYSAEAWFHKYIFPNGMLPSATQIGKSIETLFVMEDWHNFGADYDTTLMHWFKNFDNSLSGLASEYNLRFYRMWRYYLLCMAGSFRSRGINQLWQLVLSKRGVRGGYTSVR